MDIKTAKQYRNLIFAVMGVSFAIAMVGLITMMLAQGELVGRVLTKIGIFGVMAAYLLSLYVAVKRQNKIGKSTKAVLWIMIIMTIPVVYGLTTLLFVL